VKSNDIKKYAYSQLLKLGDFPTAGEVDRALKAIMSKRLHREFQTQLDAVLSALAAILFVFENLDDVSPRSRLGDTLKGIYWFGRVEHGIEEWYKKKVVQKI
jgi:hypothetical protein